MQTSAHKVSSSTIINSETITDDITQHHLTNKITPTLSHEQSKVSAICSKSITQKPATPKATKENELSRLLTAYGDCV